MIHFAPFYIQALKSERKAATGHVFSHPQSPARKAEEQVDPWIFK